MALHTLVAGQSALQSRWLVEGEPSYDRHSGEFFIQRPDIHCLDRGLMSSFMNAPGMLRDFLVEDVLGNIFASLPLYTLDPARPWPGACCARSRCATAG